MSKHKHMIERFFLHPDTASAFAVSVEDSDLQVWLTGNDGWACLSLYTKEDRKRAEVVLERMIGALYKAKATIREMDPGDS